MSAPRASAVRGDVAQWAQVLAASARVIEPGGRGAGRGDRRAGRDRARAARGRHRGRDAPRRWGTWRWTRRRSCPGCWPCPRCTPSGRVRCRGAVGRRRPGRVRHRDRAGWRCTTRCAAGRSGRLPGVGGRRRARATPPPKSRAAVVAALEEPLRQLRTAPQLRRPVPAGAGPDQPRPGASSAPPGPASRVRAAAVGRRTRRRPVGRHLPLRGSRPGLGRDRRPAPASYVTDGACAAHRPGPGQGADRPGHRQRHHHTPSLTVTVPAPPATTRARTTPRGDAGCRSRVGGPGVGGALRARSAGAPGSPDDLIEVADRAPVVSRCWSPARSSTWSPRA